MKKYIFNHLNVTNMGSLGYVEWALIIMLVVNVLITIKAVNQRIKIETLRDRIIDLEEQLVDKGNTISAKNLELENAAAHLNEVEAASESLHLSQSNRIDTLNEQNKALNDQINALTALKPVAKKRYNRGKEKKEDKV